MPGQLRLHANNPVDAVVAVEEDIKKPNLGDWPSRMTRPDAAAFLSKYYFKVSPRHLERAPLCWRILNGRAHCDTVDLVAYGESMVANAPVVMGGRRTTSTAA